jgi:hypothetical protein
VSSNTIVQIAYKVNISPNPAAIAALGLLLSTDWMSESVESGYLECGGDGTWLARVCSLVLALFLSVSWSSQSAAYARPWTKLLSMARGIPIYVLHVSNTKFCASFRSCWGQAV